MGLKLFAKGQNLMPSPGPHGRHKPKHGVTNQKYADDHGITKRKASEARRGEKWD